MSAVSICHYRLSYVEYDRAVAAAVFEVDPKLDLIAGRSARYDTGGQAPHDRPRPHDRLPAARVRSRVLRTDTAPAGDDYSEPEPDVAAVTRAMRHYRDAHPTSAVLVVEVSNESLRNDRTVKQYLYARCGIPEYWLLALPEVRLEVYRDLAADGYRSVTRHAAGNLVAPLARHYAQVVVMLVCSSTYSSPQRLSLGGRKLRTT